jgi:riboflavin synthase
MFTGLVESVGELVERKPTSAGCRVRIATPLAAELSEGDSLAVNGVCLTVIVAQSEEVHADVGPETLRVTTLGSMAPGSVVNLERPLRADGRLGGHFVQGHVDGVGHVADWRSAADFQWLTVTFPAELAPFIVHRGSIALDGISLTVAGLGPDRIDVQVVPFTLAHTNLARVQVRDRMNIECDIVGKYVARAAELAGLSLGPVRSGDERH